MPKIKRLKNTKAVILFVVAVIVVMFTAVVFKDHVRSAIDDHVVSNTPEASLDELEYKQLPRH